MKVLKNYAYNALYQIFVLIVPLVTTPYLARVLGPKGVGINSYTNSIIQYFILFGGIGVSLYGNRQIAFVRDDRKLLTKNFFEIFIMRFMAFVISGLAFFIFLSLTKHYKVYYLAQFISLVAAALDISWFFMGMEDFAVTVLKNFFVKIISLVSIFTFVKSYDDLTKYILILSLSLLIGNLTLYSNLFKYVDIPKFNTLNIFQHLWPALLLFAPQVATQTYLVLNKTMLGIMVSVESSGFFDQSDKIIKVSLAVITAMGTVMMPHVANAFSKGNKDKAIEYLYDGFSFVSALSFPMMFGLIAIVNKFVPLFFTNKFGNVIPVMISESLIIIFIAWSNAIGVQYLLPTKQVRAFTLSVVIGAVINLLANIPLIYLFGAIGAGISTTLAEFSVTFYQLIRIRKQVVFSKLFSGTFKYLVASLVMFFFVVTADRYLNYSWLSISLEIFLGAISYLVMNILLKTDIYLKLKSIINFKKYER